MLGTWLSPLVLFAAAALANEEPPVQLDADHNGLYDDTERKVMLDVLRQAWPGLEIPFDADGDGKVSVVEQGAGRHPLPALIRNRFPENGPKIPWTIDIFPEWLSSAYFQEDVPAGRVAELAPRGTIPVKAGQTVETLRPLRPSGAAGVEFAADSGQHLTMPGQRDARWNYRWCLFAFRIDATTGSGDETVLLALNQDNLSGNSALKIWYDKKSGLGIRYVGRNQGGLDRRTMTTRAVVADGKAWNVVVCGIRYGQMFASVNGVPLATREPQPARFSAAIAPDRITFLGDRRPQNAAWAYDSLIFGTTEPSEAMVRKMTGWAAHRLGFQGRLPAGHPYVSERPILDSEDFPYRYVHDDEKWTAWGQSLKKSVTRVNAGGPRVEPQDFERVFHDDFRAYRVKDSASGEGDLWMGPGFNTAVGGDAPLATPGRQPDAYPHDDQNGRQLLSLVKQGDRWRGGAFYSVNDLGYGYTWKGPKIFRIRCMFPNETQAELAGGLFPAFWSYDPDYLFWRTANRIEVDWWEFDGKNGRWLNGLSSHFHYSHIKNNVFVKNPSSRKSYKGYGGELSEAKTKIPGGIFVWDGQFHTWEFVVEEATTYANVTIPDGNGGEQWVEIYRVPTAPTYLERLDLQLDYALKAKYGLPTQGRQDFIVDSIEVFQKRAAVEAIPSPFTARPELTGANKEGSTVTCAPRLKDIADVRYYWFADDYPLTYGPSPSYTLTAAEAGKEIRCMVKAVGARDMPEAWSNTLK